MKTLKTTTVVAPLLSGLLFIALWYGVIAIWNLSPFYVPPPHRVMGAMIAEGPRLLEATLVTAGYGLSGFALAVVVGVALSVGLGASSLVRKALYPWILVLQMTPVVILAPIIVLWFDYGPSSVICIAFITSFFPIVANTTLGMVSTDPNLVDCFHVYRAKPWQEFFLLRLPSAFPYLISGIKIAATLVPIGAVFGEFFVGSFRSGKGGLGLLVFIYNKETRIPELFAAGISACLLGFILVSVVVAINWALLHKWHESYHVKGR